MYSRSQQVLASTFEAQSNHLQNRTQKNRDRSDDYLNNPIHTSQSLFDIPLSSIWIGENIGWYSGTPSMWKILDLLQRMADESQKYSYQPISIPTSGSPVTGHYTQMFSSLTPPNVPRASSTVHTTVQRKG